MLKSIKTFGNPTSSSALIALEEKLAAKLPSAYREFLLRSNGGRPVECCIDFDAPKLRCEGDTVNFFFEISEGSTYDIEHMMESFGSHIPQGMIFIGTSPGGNYFLLSLRPHSYGQVFYKDHDFEDFLEFDEAINQLPESIVKIAATFDEFLERLYDPDSEPVDE
jgi:hypothetical protein